MFKAKCALIVWAIKNVNCLNKSIINHSLNYKIEDVNIRIIITLLIISINYSCTRRSSQGQHIDHKLDRTHVNCSLGLSIKNGINRGSSYTDSTGTDFSIRNIPIKITNDSIIPVQIHINFSKEYNHPNRKIGEQFKLIPLSTSWGLDNVEISEKMLDEIPYLIQKPNFHSIIKPGEELIFSIASIYPRPAKSTGVLPRTLFEEFMIENFDGCIALQHNTPTLKHRVPLNLKVVFGEQCMIIPCGYISYLEDQKIE